MALPNKIKLPDLYIEEYQEMTRIANKPTRTTTGQATFSNVRTGANYTTVGSIYDGQGENGLFLLLYNVNPILKTYTFDDIQHNAIVAEVNYLEELTGDLSLYRNSIDSNDIFIELQYKRQDGTLFKKSTLSGGASPNYTTRTVKYYDDDGVTEIMTVVYTLSYTNGKIINEVIV